MAILYNITKTKDEYFLTVSQDTSYVIKYNTNQSFETVANKVLLANTTTTLLFPKDGSYTLELIKTGETTIIENFYIIYNLQKNLSTDIYHVLCNVPCTPTLTQHCLTEEEKKVLQVRNIFNKLLTYQSLYIPNYKVNYLTDFAYFLQQVVLLDKNLFQNSINEIVLKECIDICSPYNKDLFDLFLYFYWAGMYFIEENIINDLDTTDEIKLEELKYLKEKFYYSCIVLKYINSNFNIVKLKTIFDNTMDIVEIYSYQLDSISENINDVINSNYHLTQYTETQMEEGVSIEFTKIAKIGFIVKNALENPYTILNSFDTDITNISFDYVYQNNISYYISKEYVSHSNLYFKFVKNI